MFFLDLSGGTLLIKVSPRFIKVWQRNFDSYWKFFYVGLLGSLGDPILYLVAMGVGLGAYMGTINGTSYVQFIAPGIIISAAMFAAVYECTYESFLKMIHLKTYDAIIVTPVNIEDVVAGDILWGATKAFIGGSVMLAVVAAFGLIHSWWALFIPLLIFMVGFLFASMGMVVTAVSPTFDYINYFFEFVITPLFFFSGIFFPMDKFPPLVRFLTQFSPLTHAVEFSHSLTAGVLSARVFVNLAVVVVSGLFLFYWSIRLMKKRVIR
jgi:lipooligosaccharide transport system permease protein